MPNTGKQRQQQMKGSVNCCCDFVFITKLVRVCVCVCESYKWSQLNNPTQQTFSAEHFVSTLLENVTFM